MSTDALADLIRWFLVHLTRYLNGWFNPLLTASKSLRISRLSSILKGSDYLFGDRQALPKTLANTEMVLRFPLGFA